MEETGRTGRDLGSTAEAGDRRGRRGKAQGASLQRITAGPAGGAVMAADRPARGVCKRSLIHDRDAELAAQIGNVLARPAAKGWAIEAAVDARSHQGRRIVGAQAAMLAVHRAMTAPRPPSRAMSFGAPRR